MKKPKPLPIAVRYVDAIKTERIPSFLRLFIRQLAWPMEFHPDRPSEHLAYWAGNEQMADRMQCSLRTVKRQVRQAEDLGIIRVTRKHRHKSRIEIIGLYEWAALPENQDNFRVTPCHPTGGHGVTQQGDTVTPHKEQNQRKEIKNLPVPTEVTAFLLDFLGCKPDEAGDFIRKMEIDYGRGTFLNAVRITRKNVEAGTTADSPPGYLIGICKRLTNGSAIPINDQTRSKPTMKPGSPRSPDVVAAVAQASRPANDQTAKIDGFVTLANSSTMFLDAMLEFGIDESTVIRKANEAAGWK